MKKNQTAIINAFVAENKNAIDQLKEITGQKTNYMSTNPTNGYIGCRVGIEDSDYHYMFSNFLNKVEDYKVGKFNKIAVGRGRLHQTTRNEVDIEAIQTELKKLSKLKAEDPNIHFSYVEGGMVIAATRYQTEAEALAELKNDFERVMRHANAILEIKRRKRKSKSKNA